MGNLLEIELKQETFAAVAEVKEGQTFLSGAQAMMECLLAENVDTIFGYPGGAIMPTYDALYDYIDRINHILVRHEQGAGHAAQGFARVSGRTGVCLVTSGPGGTNLITPIADAIIDCTPMVCIVGQVKSNLLGTDAFQETDMIGVTTPVCKWNYQIIDPNEVPEIMAKAFFIAKSGKPGPSNRRRASSGRGGICGIPICRRPVRCGGRSHPSRPTSRPARPESRCCRRNLGGAK
jgi:acetolactate synthase-1/2/3 large subunit